jgi:hypothetical protein
MNEFALIKYIGRDVGDLLRSQPFSSWKPKRSIESDLPIPEVWYEFSGHGVEVICDETERVRSIFLHRGSDENLIEVPFSSTREDLRRRLGAPSKSGGPVRIPGLGNRAAWDRWLIVGAVVHAQYDLTDNAIDMITLMAVDAAP